MLPLCPPGSVRLYHFEISGLIHSIHYYTFFPTHFNLSHLSSLIAGASSQSFLHLVLSYAIYFSVDWIDLLHWGFITCLIARLQSNWSLFACPFLYRTSDITGGQDGRHFVTGFSTGKLNIFIGIFITEFFISL